MYALREDRFHSLQHSPCHVNAAAAAALVSHSIIRRGEYNHDVARVSARPLMSLTFSISYRLPHVKLLHSSPSLDEEISTPACVTLSTLRSGLHHCSQCKG